MRRGWPARTRPSLLSVVAVAVTVVASAVGPPAAGAQTRLGDLVADLGAGRPETPAELPALLWSMARDAAYADAVLARADRSHRALVDTLLAFVSLEEPAARIQLPGLYQIRDDVLSREGRPPGWADVQWQGVRLLRVLAPEPGRGRDVRLVRELDGAMARVGVPQPAAVAGAVLVLRAWWAERSEDPQLTHDPARIVDLTAWLRRLDLLPDDPDAWTAPRMLADLDRDLVLRERLLARLDPERHAHLAAELTAVLPILPDSLAALGIEPPRWDPASQKVIGHAAVDLWRLALQMLEIITGEAFSGADDQTRRLAALLWWDGHRHEARYWRDPRQAPDLGRFLRGLDVPESKGGQNAGAWARSLYIEPAVAELVLERLGPAHRGMVAELIVLVGSNRNEAHAAGFVMATRRRSVIAAPGTGEMMVSIIWSEARVFVRRLLEALTDTAPPAGSDADAADAFWLEWWEAHRDDPQWTRAARPEAGRR